MPRVRRLVGWLRARGWALILLPLVCYTAAAVFMTWPLATQLSTHVGGGGFGDSFEYVRLGWWGAYALQNGLDPFFQSLFGYPEGIFSAAQAAQPLIYWPITLLNYPLGPVAAFNVWLLLSVILTGLTAYWLCRAVLADIPLPVAPERGRTPAALIGGLIVMAFPAVQGHLVSGHINPLANYALPVVALCLWRIGAGQGGLRMASLGAVALLILGLGNLTFPAYALLPLLLFGGIGAWLAGWARPDPRALLVMLGGGALLLLPFYWPLISEALAADRPAYLAEGGAVRYSADLLAFVSRSPFTPWAGETPDFSREVLGTNATEGAAYLGIAGAGLALIGALRWWRRVLPWMIIVVGCMVFSLGPLLKWRDQPVTYRVDGLESHIVLPWALFQDWPILNLTRTPGRFNITTGLALGVLAALGLATLLRAFSLRRTRVGTATLLAVVVVFEYQLFFPFLTTPAALPAYFLTLAGRADVRAVFDVPWDDPIAQKDALYQQTAHHRPLLAGYVTRGTSVDPARLALLSDAAIGRLHNPSLEPAQVRGLLRAHGADVIVYHRALLDWEPTLAHAARLFGPPVYRDEWRAIFEVPDQTAPVTGLPMTFAAQGWWFGPDGTPWLTGDSALYVYAPAVADHEWTIQLAPLTGPRTLRLSVDGGLARAWLIDGLAALRFYLRLEPGFHTLRFTLSGGCVQSPADPACMLPAAADFAQPAAGCQPFAGEAVCVTAALGRIETTPAGVMSYRRNPIPLAAGLSLRGFRAPPMAAPGETLIVETIWHAAQPLPEDYHLFVHVLDASGRLVEQYDGVPGGGAFPTRRWDTPQEWAETAVIPLPADLPGGRYRLFAGWYPFPDLTRLAVLSDAPGAADGLVFLREFTIR